MSKEKNIFEKNPKKTIFLLLLFSSFIILFLIEFISFLIIYSKEGSAPPLFYNKRVNEINKNAGTCDLSFYDPVLGYAHSNCSKVKLKKDTRIVTHGNHESKGIFKIMTLGGSTTDPIIMQEKIDIKDRNWPKILYELCIESGKECITFNAGMGGYSSSQELIRLIRESIVLKPNIVISLNGINEWYYLKSENYLRFPYVSNYQRQLFRKLVKASNDGINKVTRFKTSTNKYFPNTKLIVSVTIRNLNSFLRKKNYKNKNFNPSDFGLYFGAENSSNNALKPWDIWKRNIQMMHAISDTLNSNYYVFLQPTLGIGNLIPNNKKDAALYDLLESDYLNQIQNFYKEAIKICDALEFCYNISNIFDNYNESLYSDARHPNAIGNKIIAKEIWKTIDLH